MKCSEVAEGALGLIERYGWTRHTFGNTDQGFCLMGAAFATIRRTVWTSATYPPPLLVGDAMLISTTLSPYCKGIISYVNDYELKSKEEVIDLLTKTAKFWRDQGE